MLPIRSVQVFSAENSETGPRKPGNNPVLSRKPLQDRAVNHFSPAAFKEEKKEVVLEKKEQKTQEEDLYFYEKYSHKHMRDNFSDFPFSSMRPRDTLHILKSYTQYINPKTPPPSIPEDFDFFIEIPEVNHKFEEEEFHDGPLEESFESVEDVSLPSLDLSDF